MTVRSSPIGWIVVSIPVVQRRAFLRYSLVGGVTAGLGVFGIAAIGMLWPNLTGGLGATFDLGPAGEIADGVATARAPLYVPSGRFYVVRWEPSLRGAEDAYGDIAVAAQDWGLMALYQKCPHLGCRVPWCQASQWFECPCHGSKYNRWGEWQEGPAPRGLDRFPAELREGRMIVDTGTLVTGPARTANVLPQEPEGPHCVDV